jgi:hypothetical protein
MGKLLIELFAIREEVIKIQVIEDEKKTAI